MNRRPRRDSSWRTPPTLWARLKPRAREMRHAPTPSEASLWQQLRNRQIGGHKFRRQHSIGRFVVDFYCRKAHLVIEVDGPVHEYSPDEDEIREQFLRSQGLRVLRFSNHEVDNSIVAVVETIAEALT